MTKQPRTMLWLGLLGSLAMSPLIALAQPAPAPAATTAPAAPPSWKQGMPGDSEATAKIAPVFAPPLPAAPDKLPTARLKLPPGFQIEVFASGVANARSIRVDTDGIVYVSSRTVGKVYAIVEKDGKRVVKTIASGMHAPNGIALHNGTLYIAEIERISKIENIAAHLDDPPKPVVIYSDLPNDEPHGWKFLAVGPDNKLYFNIGAPCNICMPPPTHAQLRRINLDGTGAEVIARGTRQVVGMDFHPVSHTLYFSENQRDWLSEDSPQDKLNRLVNPGKDHFGYPFCHGGDMLDPQFGWGHKCDEFVKPVAQVGPHTAPLGLRFYTGKMFPAAYTNAVFLALHGSWNKSQKIGGDVVIVKLNPDGTFKSMEPFITGFIVDNNYIGRPVDMAWMKDGSMLLTDDYNGAVYRITYGPQKH